jgi:hypothetical protein
VENHKSNLNLIPLSVFAFLFLSLTAELSSQDYPVREYGVRDGLPQSQANEVFQDSRGFLWIITRNGLSRFDGIDFINYYSQDGLPSNSVYQVSEDKNGDIWVLAQEGISKFTGKGFRFYPPDNGFEEVNYFSHKASTENPGKFFLLGSNRRSPYSSLYMFDNGTYSFYASKFPELDTLKFAGIISDTSGSELVITDIYRNQYTWKNNKLAKLRSGGNFNLLNLSNGILLWNFDTTMIYSDGRISRYIIGKKPDMPEARFIRTTAGTRILYFDGSKNITIKPPVYPSVPYVDHQGTLWMPSDRNLFRLLSTSFTTISDDLIKQSNLWAVCMDKNQDLWVGSLEGNLFQYDGKNFRTRNDYKKHFPEGAAFYKGSRLLSNGEMWMSLNLGVLIWDGKEFKRLKGLPENTQVCIIYEDPDDHTVFLGTDRGVFRIRGESIECFPRFNDSDLGVVEGIVKDDSGFYWMSGHRSVVRFDGADAEKVNDPVLPGAFTFTVEKDSRGGIWLSSDGGLYFKKKGEKLFRHGLPSGLNNPANVVRMMDESHLLAGRGGDICIIDLNRFYNDEKDYFRIYDKTDGFQGGECLDNGIINYRNGTFVILTSDGIVRFDPEAVRKNSHPPETRFTGLYYQTDSLSWEAVREDEFYFRSPVDIVLDWRQNKIKIRYTGISTQNPEKVKYKYMLEGLEKKWTLPTLEREAVYDNLRHGHYRFLLKAINADGIENPEPVELRFRILPSFTETRFFVISMFLIVIAGTILFTRFILKRNHRIKEETQKVTSELIKMQISAVLKELDPHFTFNAISSIGYLIMEGKRQEAYNYLTRLSTLLRTILYDGTTISRPLSEELDFISNYCELQQLRFGDRFKYEITVADNVETYREVPKMAIQIFVENSIKHGFESDRKEGLIEIILTQADDFIKIIIRDNGIGRAASMKLNTPGSGYGIKTVKRIFEIMNYYNSEKATVVINDLENGETALGTEVILRIPVNYNFTTGKHHRL